MVGPEDAETLDGFYYHCRRSIDASLFGGLYTYTQSYLNVISLNYSCQIKKNRWAIAEEARSDFASLADPLRLQSVAS